MEPSLKRRPIRLPVQEAANRKGDCNMKGVSTLTALAVLIVGAMIFGMSISASTSEIDAGAMLVVTIAPTA